MCGIFGYVGNRQAKDIIIDGLKKLEYRGYDSAGLSVVLNKNILTLKEKGDVSKLETKLCKSNVSGNVGIGHTRWATHGKITLENAHPHNSADGCFSIVHNGIIENYLEIKMFAEDKGYKFKSDTDSEIIASMLQLYFNGDVLSTLIKVFNMLSGAFAVAILSTYTPERIYVFKSKSPLIVSNCNNECFVSSDIHALPVGVSSYYCMEDKEIAVLSKDAIFYDCFGNSINKEEKILPVFEDNYTLNGFSHYMMKEISEQANVVRRCYSEFNKQKNLLTDILSDNVYIVGCGSAYNAGLLGGLMLEKGCNIRIKNIVASEYNECMHLVKKNDLVIAVSQSGETADTLIAVKRLRETVHCRVLAIVNVENSSLEKISDYVLYTKAGKEVSVATTKCYFAQSLMLMMLANVNAINKPFSNNGTIDKLENIVKDLISVDVSGFIEEIAVSNVVFFVGKGIDYYVALEAALKLKEVCYINAEAYPSGELKHGSIALVDNRTVAVLICTDKFYLDKNISAIKEISSRGGYVVAVVTEDCKQIGNYADDVIIIPNLNRCLDSLLSIIPLQLIAYNTANRIGVDVDKPRNLAKSVTVE